AAARTSSAGCSRPAGEVGRRRTPARSWRAGSAAGHTRTRNDQGLHRKADAVGRQVRVGTLFDLVLELLALGIRHPPQLVAQSVGRLRADFEIAIERRQIDIETN